MTNRGFLRDCVKRSRSLGEARGVTPGCLLPAHGRSCIFLYPVPPRIIGQNSEQVTTILNSSVTLTCEVHAHPSPEVTWYKDGQVLSLGKEIFLLPGE